MMIFRAGQRIASTGSMDNSDDDLVRSSDDISPEVKERMSPNPESSNVITIIIELYRHIT